MSFNVYSSSAGSGKTFTLVKEYLKILLNNPSDFKHILAITFTNKAANEMKERVISALKGLSGNSALVDSSGSTQLLALLMQETKLEQPLIAKRSAEALELILHHYSDFSIGTIDSFSHKLIKTFAHDFRLPVNFSVELETDELLATAVNLLLDGVGENRELTDLLVGFLETRLDEDKGWNIEEILVHFAKNLLDEEGQIRIDRLGQLSLHQLHQISVELTRQIKIFENQIIKLAEQAAGIISNNNIPVEAFYYGDKGVAKYFINLTTGRFDKLEPNSYVMKTIEEDKWHGGKVNDFLKREIDAIKPELLNLYGQIQLFKEQNGSDYRLRKLLAKTIYPLAVLHEIELVLTQFKKQHNLIHISEFNARIASIVMNEPVPFIYERLGEKYHHILIDEFQDTSVLQWMNFIPLIENSLANGYFNLVVGDGKQAIYRWRSGDIEQFNNLPNISGSEIIPVLKQREQALTSHFVKLNLDRNYRSRAEIVEFNNQFFRILANQVLTSGKDKVFEGLEQQFDSKNTGGFISLEFLAKDDDTFDFESLTLNRILEIIEISIRDNFSFKDVAILCRSNKNASRIASFLLANGIGVVSAESLLIRNSFKIKFIIAVLRLIYEQSNDIVLEEVRMFLKINDNYELVKLTAMLKELAVLPVYDLCESIIRKFDLNSTTDPYIQFFLDVVLKFSIKTSHSAVDFLDYWKKNNKKFSISVPEALNAVKVLTIHKAKGLQFPVVILPFAQESRSNTKTYLWVDLDKTVAPGLETAILRSDKDMEATVYEPLFRDEQEKSMLDLLNLLYVAMTRPEEQLYILTSFVTVKSDSLDSLPKFFTHFLQVKGLFEAEKSYYEFGIRTHHLPKKDKVILEPIVLNEFISSDWKGKVNIRYRAPQSWDPESAVSKTDWGNRIHTILSYLISAQDIPQVLDRAITTGLIESKDYDHVADLLMRIVQHQQLKDCYDGQFKIKTEPEILVPGGTFYRPDRVVVINNSNIIIDYKSGTYRPEHARQLSTYSGYMAAMGYENIKCLLVYLEPVIKVIEV